MKIYNKNYIKVADFKKCARVALAIHNKTQAWFADEIGVTRKALSKSITIGVYVHAEILSGFLKIFNYTIRQFLALGELK